MKFEKDEQLFSGVDAQGIYGETAATVQAGAPSLCSIYTNTVQPCFEQEMKEQTFSSGEDAEENVKSCADEQMAQIWKDYDPVLDEVAEAGEIIAFPELVVFTSQFEVPGTGGGAVTLPYDYFTLMDRCTGGESPALPVAEGDILEAHKKYNEFQDPGFATACSVLVAGGVSVLLFVLGQVASNGLLRMDTGFLLSLVIMLFSSLLPVLILAGGACFILEPICVALSVSKTLYTKNPLMPGLNVLIGGAAALLTAVMLYLGEVPAITTFLKVSPHDITGLGTVGKWYLLAWLLCHGGLILQGLLCGIFGAQKRDVYKEFRRVYEKNAPIWHRYIRLRVIWWRTKAGADRPLPTALQRMMADFEKEKKFYGRG